jgi:hypothetical protein
MLEPQLEKVTLDEKVLPDIIHGLVAALSSHFPARVPKGEINLLCLWIPKEDSNP